MKARDLDPGHSLAVCDELGARQHGTLSQRDTYFRARRGRLKLREEAGAEAHLIAYERPDSPNERESRYRIVIVTDPVGTTAALDAALGVEVVVAKERRLFLWRGVRIHLDQIAGLGNFVEFEAVAAAESDLSRERELVSELRATFRIGTGDLLSGSYRDLALAA